MNEARLHLSPRFVDVVIYHRNCFDGATAAFVAYFYLNQYSLTDRINQFIPLGYNDPIPHKEIKKKNLLVLDFSFKKADLEKVRQEARCVLILAHHISAYRELKDEPGVYIDKSHSGAVLAWKYFFRDTAIPRFIQYIEDRDLWCYKFGCKTRYFHHGMKHVLLNQRTTLFHFPKYYLFLSRTTLQETIKIGKIEYEKEQGYLRMLANSSSRVRARIGDTIQGAFKIAYLELHTQKDWSLRSELSEIIYTNHSVDFVMVWIRTRDCYKVSLRSNTSVDVAAIAQQFGGGGDPAASGFKSEDCPLSLLCSRVGDMHENNEIEPESEAILTPWSMMVVLVSIQTACENIGQFFSSLVESCLGLDDVVFAELEQRKELHLNESSKEDTLSPTRSQLAPVQL